MNYALARSLEEDEMWIEAKRLEPDDKADLAAFADDMGYAPGDIIDLKLWNAWLDKMEADETVDMK